MKDIKPELPLKGIHLDHEPTKQPQGTTRFTLNGVDDSNEGSLTSITNEESNELCFPIPTDFEFLGHTAISNNNTIIYSTDGSISKIGVTDGCCQYKDLITTDCLGFNNCYPIQAEFKVIKGCERILSIYDGLNDDLYINIDKLELYYTDSYNTWLETNVGTSEEYFIATGLYAWDCNKMKFQPDFNYPCIEYVNTLEGQGNLKMGTYAFAVELLDSSKNRIAITPITKTINIIDESLSSNWYKIDGGYNIDNYPAEIGGVLPPNHAVALKVTDIPEVADCIRFALIEIASGDGVTATAYFVNEYINVSESTEVDYTITGFNLLITSIGELTTPKINYNVSSVQEQVNNRLLKANLKEKTWDYATIQKAANTIETQYAIPELGQNIYSELTNSANTKFPEYYFFNRSYMRDEIYALGIMLEFKDGTFSPVMHIPGREEIVVGDSLPYLSPTDLIEHGNSNSHNRNQVPRIGAGDATNEDWDNQLLEVVPNVDIKTGTGGLKLPVGYYNNRYHVFLTEVKHLGFGSYTDDIGYGIGANGGGLVPRWKVVNTAIKFISPDFKFNHRGLMAYYECSKRYPETKDCEGNFIYPTDTIDPTQTTYIRHHKFPDATLENPEFVISGGNNRLLPIGVVFDTTAFYAALPQEIKDNINGHHFVRSLRTPENKTVIDKGYYYSNTLSQGFSNTKEFKPQIGQDGQGSLGVFGFLMTPKINFLSQGVNSSSNYIKYERSMHFGNSAPYTNYIYDQFLHRYWTNSATVDSATMTFFNRSFDQATFLDVAENEQYLVGDRLFENAEFNKGVVIYTEDGDLPIADELYPIVGDEGCYMYISIKTNIEPYCNLDLINYVMATNCSQQEVNFLADVTSPIYGGDIFISSIEDLAFINIIEKSGGLIVIPPFLGGIPPGSETSLLVESEINANLRHSIELTADDDDGLVVIDNCGEHYQKILALGNTELGGSPYTIYRFQRVGCVTCCETNPFFYNLDYSKESDFNIYKGLSSTFDLCSECQGEYPNRIAWSEVSFENELSDGWKSFLANNFTDVEAGLGDITNIKFEKNEMLVATEDSLLQMIPNPQAIQATGDNVYIGTGDFLSIPPKAFKRKAYGYAGNQGKFNAINTEYGWVWADQKDGKIFLYNTNLEVISNNGMYHWFRNNLPSKLQKWFKERDLESNCIDSTVNTHNGVGLIATYDPKYERYILHKKDVLPLVELEGLVGESEVIGALYYNPEDSTFYTWNGSFYSSLRFSNPTFFRTYSWTISYSFKYRAWRSWHSYMPNYMFHDNNRFYSSIDSNLWVHDSKTYGRFYGTQFDFITEYVVKDIKTMDLHSVHWYSQASQWDDVNKLYLDIDNKCFDYLMAYNSCQSTGKAELSFTKNSLDWDNDIKPIKLTDKNYKVSQLRDLSLAQPTLTSDWNYIPFSTEFNKTNGYQGYTDKVPYLPNLNNNDFFQEEQRDLKDKYFIIRLYFENQEDYKLTLDLINTQVFYSQR